MTCTRGNRERQQPRGACRRARDELGATRVKTSGAELRGQDHQRQEEQECRTLNGPPEAFDVERTGRKQDGERDERDAGSVELEAGEAPERHAEIGCRKDGEHELGHDPMSKRDCRGPRGARAQLSVNVGRPAPVSPPVVIKLVRWWQKKLLLQSTSAPGPGVNLPLTPGLRPSMYPDCVIGHMPTSKETTMSMDRESSGPGAKQKQAQQQAKSASPKSALEAQKAQAASAQAQAASSAQAQSASSPQAQAASAEAQRQAQRASEQAPRSAQAQREAQSASEPAQRQGQAQPAPSARELPQSRRS